MMIDLNIRQPLIMLKALLLVGSFAVASNAAGYDGHGKGKSQGSGDPAEKTKVFMENLKKTHISKKSYYYGHIAPDKVGNVYAPLDSIIDKLPFAPGEEVKKGQVVAILRPTGIDDSRNLMRLESPFDGVILDLPMSESDLSKKNSILVKIYSPGTYKSKIHVTQDDVIHITRGQSADVEFNQKSLKASVYSISHKVDRSLGTQEVLLKIKNSTGLRPGQLVKFGFKHGEKEGFLVSKTMIKESGNGHFVQTLESGSKVKQIQVTIGIKNPEKWEIIAPELAVGLPLITKASKEPLKSGQEVLVSKQPNSNSKKMNAPKSKHKTKG